MTKTADLKLSIPLEAIDLDRVIGFCVQAFVVDAQEIVRVENDHPHPDGFGVYALFWGETLHVADRKDRTGADEVCLALNNILAEQIRAYNQEKEAHMPKISIKGSHDLAISTSELEALDIVNFEVTPWAYEAHEDKTAISAVDNLEEANGVGVYARLTNGLAAHVKDFIIDPDALGLDAAEEAQNAAIELAETLNAYLPATNRLSTNT
jgi:hypothetical protein